MTVLGVVGFVLLASLVGLVISLFFERGRLNGEVKVLRERLAVEDRRGEVLLATALEARGVIRVDPAAQVAAPAAIVKAIENLRHRKRWKILADLEHHARLGSKPWEGVEEPVKSEEAS